MWKARGIRGVLLGPCDKELCQPPFEWNDLAWVAIGHSLSLPLLHRVRRDFDADIERAIARLTQKGGHRPGFLSEPESHHLFHTSLLRSALTYYHTSGESCPEPYIELPFNDVSRFRAWIKSMRIDSLIVSRPMPLLQSAVGRKLPSVILSPNEQGVIPERCDGFIANYQAMGHTSINLMHHLLMNRHLGIPELPQTMLASSPWHQFRTAPGKFAQ
ncbi:MAG: hypothetical protein B9S32_09060 [Verrucomicrobia bacterium Tous-C9LFEB]|nr:MAG: hypothetical protein B9S32_09060 [Verrucomicrobia bacterium Tous-C9LFEB]